MVGTKAGKGSVGKRRSHAPQAWQDGTLWDYPKALNSRKDKGAPYIFLRNETIRVGVFTKGYSIK